MPCHVSCNAWLHVRMRCTCVWARVYVCLHIPRPRPCSHAAACWLYVTRACSKNTRRCRSMCVCGVCFACPYRCACPARTHRVGALMHLYKRHKRARVETRVTMGICVCARNRTCTCACVSASMQTHRRMHVYVCAFVYTRMLICVYISRS